MTAAAKPRESAKRKEQGKRQRPRTCVLCREEAPKRALIRLVRSPEGTVYIDEKGKLPGRGAYLCARVECLEKAKKNNSLARSLKTAVPSGLYEQLAEYVATYREKRDEAAVRRELRALLGLSRRAALVYIGIDSVKSQCKTVPVKEPMLILTALDASASVLDTVYKLVEGTGRLHMVAPLDVETFSSAIGATGVQVVALPSRNGLTDKIKLLLSS